MIGTDHICGKWYLEIKENILRQMNIKCPLCESDMFIGAVTVHDPTPCLFCGECSLRIAIHQIIVESPKEIYKKNVDK